MILTFFAGIACGVLILLGALGLIAALVLAAFRDVARAALGGD